MKAASASEPGSERVYLGFTANLEHAHAWKTVEKHTRAQQAFDHVAACGLVERTLTLPSSRAITNEELRTVHTERHIVEVDELTAASAADPTNRQLREPDGPGGVYYSPHAASAARLACGCVVDAALTVLRRKDQRTHSFAIVRPPGHHAGFDDTPGHRAEGFCFFNNVAVAAGCALASGEAGKVAVVDWDVHHGNGTQHLFLHDNRVLYISLHRFGDGWYPLSGGVNEVGEAEGTGTTVNIPWPENGVGDADYLAAFHTIVLPLLAQWAPDLVLVSAGFDAAEGDPQGRMAVSPLGFGAMTAALMRAVTCPLTLALEGGYNGAATAACCAAVLRALLGDVLPLPPKQALARCCEPTIRNVLSVQRAHWPVLQANEAFLDDFFRRAGEGVRPARASKRSRSQASSTRASSTSDDQDEPYRGAGLCGPCRCSSCGGH